MYSFSILRFVPNPARGEFVNVGAIAGDDDAGDWDLRVLSNWRRARAIDTEGLLPAAMGFLAELEERLPTDDPETERLSLDDLRDLSARMNNIVQITQPHAVTAGDAAEALDLVCRDLLLDPATMPQARYRNRLTAVGAASRAYRSIELAEDHVARAVEVAAGSSTGTFDFAVHNGHAVQLAKCFSFELPDQTSLAHDVAAWAWLAHEVRERGARVIPREGQRLDTDARLDIACVYVPPRQQSPAFDQANEAFNELEITARSVTQAEDVARRAAGLLSGAIA